MYVDGGVVLVCVLEEEMEGRARGVGSRPGVLRGPRIFASRTSFHSRHEDRVCVSSDASHFSSSAHRGDTFHLIYAGDTEVVAPRVGGIRGSRAARHAVSLWRTPFVGMEPRLHRLGCAHLRVFLLEAAPWRGAQGHA